MNSSIIILAKLVQKILKFKGRGSSYPGRFATKFNKDILKYFKMPKTTIVVTGTTGKTSVTGMLVDIYREAGFKVGTNAKGSNLSDGVISTLIDNCKLNGQIKTDVLILEIDERYIKKVFKEITPDYFLINNLSRDQLARNGHFEIVYNEIVKSISKKTHLILNADDPLLAKIGLNHKLVSYFSLDKNSLSTTKNRLETLDLAYCPKCHAKLHFNYFQYGNLGDYYCPKCDFKKPMPFVSAKLSQEHVKIENNFIKLPNEALYNAYNILASYTLGKVAKIESDAIVKALNNLSLKVKRFKTFEINKINGTVLLSKNETPISYNQSIEYVSRQKMNKTIAIGFTRISGRYDFKDLSWLYDINFEMLNEDTNKQFIIFGPFAFDIVVRLKLAGIDSKKISVCLDQNKTLEYLTQKTKHELYCLFYFDMDKLFTKQLETRVK